MNEGKKIHVLDGDQGYVSLVDWMGTSKDIVNNARLSFDKMVKEMRPKDVKLLKFLALNAHTSPLERAEFCFEFYMPLFCFRQGGKHRAFDFLPDAVEEANAFKYWSRNEVSRRYTSEGLDFYLPKVFRKQASYNKQSSEGELENTDMMAIDLSQTVADCVAMYKHMLEKGVCREQARMVLPQNMMIKFSGKVDGNNLMKYLILRCAPDAQWEIRQYAWAMYDLTYPYVKELWDFIFGEEMLNYSRG